MSELFDSKKVLYYIIKRSNLYTRECRFSVSSLEPGSPYESAISGNGDILGACFLIPGRILVLPVYVVVVEFRRHYNISKKLGGILQIKMIRTARARSPGANQ